MRRKIRRKTRRWIRKLGKLKPRVRLKVNNFADVLSLPRDSWNTCGPVLTTIPVEKVSSLFCPLDSRGPFVEACLEILKNTEDSRARAERSLMRYYSNFFEARLSQIIGTNHGVFTQKVDVFSFVIQEPFEESIAPWGLLPLCYPSTKWEARRIALTPAARGSGDFERLSKVVHSIQSSGYRGHAYLDGDIEVEALVTGDSFRFHVLNGNHRAAALSALGWQSIPVRVRRLVFREEFAFWPKVQDGTFSPREALAIFDRFFID